MPISRRLTRKFSSTVNAGELMERLKGDLGKLRAKIRAREWSEAVAICRRVSERLEWFANGNGHLKSRRPPVVAGATVTAIGDWVPLSHFASELKLDRRTVSKRLDADRPNNPLVKRLGPRTILVARSAALALFSPAPSS
jgi:hypothetical protein